MNESTKQLAELASTTTLQKIPVAFAYVFQFYAYQM
jgi:hypothetical protein